MNVWASAEGAERATCLSALQEDHSLLCGTNDTNKLCTITPFDVVGILLLEADNPPIDDRFPVLSLDCSVEHVVEVSVGLTDGNRIHFGRVEGGRGDQVSNLFPSTLMSLLACPRKPWLSQGCGGSQSLDFMFYGSLCPCSPLSINLLFAPFIKRDMPPGSQLFSLDSLCSFGSALATLSPYG